MHTTITGNSDVGVELHEGLNQWQGSCPAGLMKSCLSKCVGGIHVSIVFEQILCCVDETLGSGPMQRRLTPFVFHIYFCTFFEHHIQQPSHLITHTRPTKCVCCVCACVCVCVRVCVLCVYCVCCVCYVCYVCYVCVRE